MICRLAITVGCYTVLLTEGIGTLSILDLTVLELTDYKIACGFMSSVFRALPKSHCICIPLLFTIFSSYYMLFDYTSHSLHKSVVLLFEKGFGVLFCNFIIKGIKTSKMRCNRKELNLKQHLYLLLHCAIKNKLKIFYKFTLQNDANRLYKNLFLKKYERNYKSIS